jgi:hypothetical protein
MEEQIKQLEFEVSGETVEDLDIELLMDIEFATTVKQRCDLLAMIEVSKKKAINASEILYNVLHDLVGLRCVYLEHPSGRCFVPRSFGYVKKLENI